MNALRNPAALLPLLLAASISGCPDDDDDNDAGSADGGGDLCEELTCDGTCCGDRCVNTERSLQDCGACDSPCDLAQANICMAAECVCGSAEDGSCAGTPGETCCPFGTEPATCVDTTADPMHCSGCNVTCLREVEGEWVASDRSDRCVDGQCVCGSAGTACDGDTDSTCCPDDSGDASCHNIISEIEHCGGCSRACDPVVSSICFVADCVCGIPEEGKNPPAACTPPMQCCVDDPDDQQSRRDAVCADLQSDREHCGDCATRCPEGQQCVKGDCV